MGRMANPERFYLLKIQDMWRIVESWSDDAEFQQMVVRKQTEILAEVINRSMGGGGVKDFVRQCWQLRGDTKPHHGIDQSKISLILAAHREAREKNKRNAGISSNKNIG